MKPGPPVGIDNWEQWIERQPPNLSANNLGFWMQDTVSRFYSKEYLEARNKILHDIECKFMAAEPEPFQDALKRHFP